MDIEIYEPARWFMHHDSDAHVVFDNSFSAYSGAGMEYDEWIVMHGAMYFWSPNGKVEVVTRNNLSNDILSENLDADYILSTHDLTNYYPSVQDIYMNIPVSPMKSQDKVDWHIYKVR